jgi:ABC-2 type transport system ATP-binding protein
VTVIARGRTMAEGPVTGLLAGHDRGEFRVLVADVARAVTIISDTGLPVTAHGDHFVVTDLADPTWLSRTLGRNGLWVSELTPVPPGLESVYRTLTGVRPPPSAPASAPGAAAPTAPPDLPAALPSR